MSIRIEDGQGSGNLAAVSSNKKLRTYATTESEASFESEANGECYSWSSSYDYAAGDTVLLIKNTNATKNLLIEYININCDTSTQTIIHSPACETPAGTAVTGVNMNRTSGKIAQSTAKQNETSNTQSNVLVRMFVKGGENSIFLNLQGIIVLGFNDCLAIDYVTEGGACYVSVLGYFHSID